MEMIYILDMERFMRILVINIINGMGISIKKIMSEFYKHMIDSYLYIRWL